jgi:hypothetical protein
LARAGGRGRGAWRLGTAEAPGRATEAPAGASAEQLRESRRVQLREGGGVELERTRRGGCDSGVNVRVWCLVGLLACWP